MEFMQYWQHTDLVSKSLFFALFVLSLATWVVGIMRVVSSKGLAQSIEHDLRESIHAHSQSLKGLSFDQRKTALEQLLLCQLAHYRFLADKGMALLGTTASIAPFIGLFGTVWGIFHALSAIGKSGQAGLAQVAAPVGEALIMTGLGLAVAIPAVVFYNLSARLNKKALHQANMTAHTILADSAAA